MSKVFVKCVIEMTNYIMMISIEFGCIYGNVCLSHLLVTTVGKLFNIERYKNPDISVELVPFFVLFLLECLLFDYYCMRINMVSMNLC